MTPIITEQIENVTSTPHYVHTNSAGTTYYLHETKTGGRTLRYFSRQLNAGKAIALPLGYEVVEHGKTGMPMLKKITNAH